jgi:hypothetical protein
MEGRDLTTTKTASYIVEGFMEEKEEDRPQEAAPEEKPEEKRDEPDLNLLFPGKGYDLNRLFPDAGSRKFLYDLRRNKKDIERLIKNLQLEEE